MRHLFRTALPVLVVAALLAPPVALADEAQSDLQRLTAEGTEATWRSKAVIEGRLTSKKDHDEIGEEKGVPDVEVVIYDEEWNEIGRGTTDKDGYYDIKVSAEKVEGQEFWFEADTIEQPIVVS